MIENWTRALCPHLYRITCCLLLLLLAKSCVNADNRFQAPPWSPMDYRVAFTEDLINRREAEVFYDRQFYNYTAFIVDSRSLIFVIGAKNSLLVLNGRDLNLEKTVNFGKKQIAHIQSYCTTCKLDVYISLMQMMQLDPHMRNLIICFSYQFDQNSQFRLNDDQPMCNVYSIKTLNFESWAATYQSLGFAPYNALSQNSFLAANDKYLYIAGPLTYDSDYRIVRRAYPRPDGRIPRKGNLGTPRGDSRYFNGRTDFVDSFQSADAVYFVFRETSLEQQMCCRRKARITRIARICKNDPGGSGTGYPSRSNFITFLKASLNCPIDANLAFRFDEAQSVFWDEAKGLLFAVFTTADGSPSGSGLCVYQMSAFNEAFSGPYKRETSGSELFKQHRNNRPVKCSELQNVTSDARARDKWRKVQSQIAYSYRLMAKSILPQRNRVTFARYGDRWTHVVADRPHLPPSEKRSIVVIFLATQRGSILKLALITASRTCEVEELRFGDESERVSAMQLFDHKELERERKTRYLLLTTNKRILKLPVQRCARFKTEVACHLARDPYCGWDPNNEECAPYEPAEHTTWTQELDGCPNERHPNNPRWSLWSTWETCATLRSRETMRERQRIEEVAGPNCLCRQQHCLYPELCAEEAERGGGEMKSTGTRVQVSNCTVDGSWSPWSFWSPCSAACGPGTRQRTRTCTNPSPQFGGKVCAMKAKEKQSCEQKACTEVDGTWTTWSLWSECSTRCGDGYQRRRRSCSPASQRCLGDSQEWRSCSTRHSCPILQKASQWTSWLSLSPTDGQFRKRRFQFVCSATVADPKRIRIAKVISQEQYCQNSDCSGQTQKRIIVDQDGGWSDWSPWSACTKTCGAGLQERYRRCDKPYRSGQGRECVGNNKERRLCNEQSCQAWSCWSDWSHCDADCAQKRTRRCRAGYGSACKGQRQETRSCVGDDCQADVYWTQWTAWSDCSPKGTQLRERHCSPGKVCFGSNREFKSCFYIGESTSPTRGGFGILHLILTGIICLLLGSLITAVVVLLVCRPRYLRLKAQLQRVRSRSAGHHPLSSSSSPPPSLTASLQRPNNLRIVNNIHSNPRMLHSVSSSTAPLLPPRRNLPASSSGSSTMGRIYEQAGPPLPPRLTASLSRHRQPSVDDESLCKEAAL